MDPRRTISLLFALVVLVTLVACEVDTPTFNNIQDSKLFDRRIKETPRQKVIRECQQECDRFRVDCKYCHTTDKIDAIKSPDQLALNDMGRKTQIMRESPAFSLNQDCSVCHQSKFQLNRSAQKLFGPGGARQGEAQKALKPDN